eukprot:c42073_g1_i1 orf=2-283(+)
MVLLGNLRQHSEELYFFWQLIRAICTATLWSTRNKCIFQQHKEFPAKQEAEECWFKIGNLLSWWPGKGKEDARRVACACKRLINISPPVGRES